MCRLWRLHINFQNEQQMRIPLLRRRRQFPNIHLLPVPPSRVRCFCAPNIFFREWSLLLLLCTSLAASLPAISQTFRSANAPILRKYKLKFGIWFPKQIYQSDDDEWHGHYSRFVIYNVCQRWSVGCDTPRRSIVCVYVFACGDLENRVAFSSEMPLLHRQSQCEPVWKWNLYFSQPMKDEYIANCKQIIAAFNCLCGEDWTEEKAGTRRERVSERKWGG